MLPATITAAANGSVRWSTAVRTRPPERGKNATVVVNSERKAIVIRREREFDDDVQ
jgi:hypothetical protein